MVVNHTGRTTVVSVEGDEQQVQAFRDALIRREFFVESQTDKLLELGRKTRLLAGDWPMKVLIHRDVNPLKITYFMFVPWSWIVLFGLMVLVFLPFAAFQGAPLAFLLGLGIMMLAVYKQKLDLSPRAHWQRPPRKQWGEILRNLILECFDGTQSS